MPLAAITLVFRIVVEAASRLNFLLQVHKCAFHVPALASVAMDNWPQEARDFNVTVPHENAGLILLGTDASDVSIPLIPPPGQGSIPRPTQLRKEKALKLAGAIVEMLNLAPPAAARQAGFTLARCIVAHSLDYDAGVLTCSALLPHAGDIDNAVRNIAAATLGVHTHELTDEIQLQLQLPTCYAGLQLDSASHVVPLARAAKLVELGPLVRAQVASWESPENPLEPKMYDGIDQAMSEDILGLLAARGIAALGGGGRPLLDAVQGPSEPLRPAAPERHLLSAYLRHSATVRYNALLNRADERTRTRLLSAAGPTAGASFVAPLSTYGVHYTDRQWAQALQWRLGMSAPGPIQPCRNMKANEELCGEVLDPGGDHAVICACGPMRIARHNDLADVYADITEEVGAIARREVFVPEFSGRTEAWLDVWAYGIQELPDALLDITVRHPGAQSYQPAAALQPGYAAARAESDKETRYAAAAGRKVWAIAHETWGRLGEKAELLLEACAAAASRRAWRLGRLPGNPLRRWRAQLDATLHKGVATQLSAARNGLPGRPHRKHAPADLAAVETRCRL